MRTNFDSLKTIESFSQQDVNKSIGDSMILYNTKFNENSRVVNVKVEMITIVKILVVQHQLMFHSHFFVVPISKFSQLELNYHVIVFIVFIPTGLIENIIKPKNIKLIENKKYKLFEIYSFTITERR